MQKPFDPNEIIKFEGFIEEQVNKLKFGTITFNVMLINGVPQMETLYYVINKRIKYPITPLIDTLSDPVI